MSTQVSTLTEREYWDEYWENSPHRLPEKIEINPNKYSRGLYSVFREHLNPEKPTSIVEIGGAPGIFLTSLRDIHPDLELGIIDYSDKGVEETNALSEKFGVPINVHQMDLYRGSEDQLPQYDVVYSLGVVEHYEDLELSLNKHLACTKPGGLVIIGLPVFLGINRWFAKWFAPENRSTWYDFIMDNKNWSKFHDRDDIEVLSDVYVGGFNPHVHHRLESKDSFLTRAVYVVNHKYFAPIWDRIPGTEKLNSKYISFFYYFVARKVR